MKRLLRDGAGGVLSILVAVAATGAELSCADHRVERLPDRCLSAPGTLDPGFGDGGFALLGANLRLQSAAVQPDGKIVATGSPRSASSNNPLEFVTVRMTREGVLDSTFGDGGQVRTAPGIAGGFASAIAVQPDGKIVVGGSVWRDLDADYYERPTAFAVVRYLANGQLDATFGDAGQVTTAIGRTASLFAVLVQPDGGILAQGQTCERSPSRCAVALARYHADGSLDATLGNGGTVVVEKVFEYGTWGRAVLQSDGRLVAAYQHPVLHLHYVCTGSRCTCTDDSGNTVNPCPMTQQERAANVASGLLRFNQDGTVDRSFGIDGTTVTPFPANQVVGSADGKTVIAGSTFVADPDHAWLTLARFGPDGSLDPTFGHQGIAANLFPGGMEVQRWFLDLPVALLRQPDGKLIAVAARGDQFDWSSILVTRFTPDGLLDPTFNVRGYIHTVETTLDFPSDATLRPDGKLIVVADVWEQGSGLIGYRGDEVVEFRNSESGHYFMTVDPAEQASIAAGGSGPGWTLTGESFKSNASTRVCRFAGAAGGGSRSHFFTLDPLECERVKLDYGWRFEGYDFAALPQTAGNCPAVSIPVYRAYNNGFPRNDSNHRYTTSEETYRNMVAAGWSGEGAVFCVPQ